MSQIIGLVEQIATRQQQTQRGMSTAYSVKVNGGWFGHGFRAPNFHQGDEIEFIATYRGQYANIELNTIRILNQGGGQPQGQYNQGTQGGNQSYQQGGQGHNSHGNSAPNYQQQGGNRAAGNRQYQNGGGQQQQGGGQKPQGNRQQSGRDQYWEQKAEDDKLRQQVIQFQASRNAAISIVDVLLREKAAPLPQKKADQLDAVLALVDTITQKFQQQTTAVEKGDIGAAFKAMEQPEDLGEYAQPQDAQFQGGQQQQFDQGNYDDDIPQ